MDKRPSETRSSLKKDMIRLLDQFLLGYVSPRELKNAVVPMLMVSGHKKGRKNYIEKYLIDISSKEESDLTRDYIYGMREFLAGDSLPSEKDRKRVFRRALRKLLERYLFDEIDGAYCISALADLSVEYDAELEPDVRKFLDDVHAFSVVSRQALERNETPPDEEALIERVNQFYEMYFRGLWDS